MCGEIAREHQRAARERARHGGRLRDRVDHQPGERALPQLAGEEALDEVRLRLGRAREQVREKLLAPRRRAGPGDALNRGDRAIELGDRRATAPRRARARSRRSSRSRRRRGPAAARRSGSRRRAPPHPARAAAAARRGSRSSASASWSRRPRATRPRRRRAGSPRRADRRAFTAPWRRARIMDEAPAFARPMRSQRTSTPHLLEREPELDALGRAVARAREGSGGCLLIEGPAGVGKSGLMASGRALAQEAGLRVFEARGAARERDFAFGVARQLFEQTVAAASDGERQALLAGAAGAVGAARRRCRPGGRRAGRGHRVRGAPRPLLADREPGRRRPAGARRRRRPLGRPLIHAVPRLPGAPASRACRCCCSPRRVPRTRTARSSGASSRAIPPPRSCARARSPSRRWHSCCAAGSAPRSTGRSAPPATRPPAATRCSCVSSWPHSTRHRSSRARDAAAAVETVGPPAVGPLRPAAARAARRARHRAGPHSRRPRRDERPSARRPCGGNRSRGGPQRRRPARARRRLRRRPRARLRASDRRGGDLRGPAPGRARRPPRGCRGIARASPGRRPSGSPPICCRPRPPAIPQPSRPCVRPPRARPSAARRRPRSATCGERSTSRPPKSSGRRCSPIWASWRPRASIARRPRRTCWRRSRARPTQPSTRARRSG